MKTSVYTIASVLALASAPMSAQTGGASSNEIPDEVYELQPFNISEDQTSGYRATTTISASRLNVPLAEVPVNIPVVTGEFIRDAAANTQREALEWTSAVEGKSIRGFDTAEFYRHGFQHLSDSHGFMIQRMEIVRGPTAILNGPIQPGGGINVITKQAVLDSTFGEIQYQYTFGEAHTYQSAGLDINAGNLGPQADYGSTAAFRMIASYQNDSGRAIGVGNSYPSVLANLRIRPVENTTLTFEYYYYRLNSDRTDHHLAINNGGNKTIPGASDGAIPIYAAYGLPYYASWNGPDGDAPEELNEIRLNWNQKLADGLYFDLSYNRHDRDLHFQNTASHGGITGGFALVEKEDSDGNFTDPSNYLLRRGARDAFIGNVTDQISALLTYSPEINGQRDHRFLAGYQTFKQDRFLHFADAYRVDDPSQKYYQFFDPFNYRNETPESLELGFGDFFYDFNNPVLERIEENEQNTLFLTWTGKWLDQRLITMAGVFQTDMNQVQSNLGGPLESRFDGSKTLPQLGVVYDFTDQWGVYAAYTESSAINTNQAPPQDNPDFFFPPKTGKMVEVGMRFNVLNEMLVGSVGVYQINQIDLVKLDSNGNLVQLGDVESKGVDFDLFYYPMKNWSVIFGYSYNDKSIPDDVGGSAADASEFRSPPNKWSLWTKYSFTEGMFDGVSIGGGFRWTEGTPFSVAGISGTNPNATRADVFIQKQGRLTDDVDYMIGLNIRNLTGQHNLSNQVVVSRNTYTGAVPESDGQRYEFDTEPEYMVTFGLKF